MKKGDDAVIGKTVVRWTSPFVKR